MATNINRQWLLKSRPEGMISPDQEVTTKLKAMRDRVRREIKAGRWDDDVRRMEDALKAEGVRDPVMEVFSPCRVNGMAAKLGFAPGLSLDLSTNDPDDNQPWDFNNVKKRRKALDLVLQKHGKGGVNHCPQNR